MIYTLAKKMLLNFLEFYGLTGGVKDPLVTYRYEPRERFYG